MGEIAEAAMGVRPAMLGHMAILVAMLVMSAQSEEMGGYDAQFSSDHHASGAAPSYASGKGLTRLQHLEKQNEHALKAVKVAKAHAAAAAKMATVLTKVKLAQKTAGKTAKKLEAKKK